jgi:hypothetical protein
VMRRRAFLARTVGLNGDQLQSSLAGKTLHIDLYQSMFAFSWQPIRLIRRMSYDPMVGAADCHTGRYSRLPCSACALSLFRWRLKDKRDI